MSCPLEMGGDKKVTQRGRFMDVQAPYLLSLHYAGRIAGRIERPFLGIAVRICRKNIFGTADPIGRTMKIDNRMSVKVAGVYEDLPANSQFQQCALYRCLEIAAFLE
jgi:putative ABC transport system permease protein